MPAPLIEFPADDPKRARRFWNGVLGAELAPRESGDGEGWELDSDGLRLGVHERGPGPGDTAALPYLTVTDLPDALRRVEELGGSVIHPGERWAVCRDSEGSPFALAAGPSDPQRGREAPKRVEIEAIKHPLTPGKDGQLPILRLESKVGSRLELQDCGRRETLLGSR